MCFVFSKMDKETLFNILSITKMFSHCIIIGYAEDTRTFWDSFRCALIHSYKKSEVHLNLRVQNLDLLFVHEARLKAWQLNCLLSISDLIKPASFWSSFPPSGIVVDIFYFSPLDSVLIVCRI